MGNAKKVEVKDVSDLVAEFRNLAGKSTANILEISRVVLAAKQLGNPSFQNFCGEIGFLPKSATIRKHEAIGKKYEVLSKNKENLPFNWTTLYKISLIAENELKEMIGDGKINRSMTGADAKKLAGVKSKKKLASASNIDNSVPNGTLSGYGVRFQFANPPADIRKLKDLIAQLESFGAEVETTPSLEAFFEDAANEQMPLAA